MTASPDHRYALAEWASGADMNAMEAAMWRAERHPQFSDTGTIVSTLDRTPDWDRLRDAHAWAVRAVPRLGERVQEPLVPLGPPRWVTDTSFDLDYHLHRIRLTGSGTMADLMTFAQAEAVAPLDRHRPLWTGTLVEGLEDGRAAYVFKTHHCLTDGMGAIQLIGRLHSRTRETSQRPLIAAPRHRPAPSGPGLAADHLGAAVRGALPRASELLSGLTGVVQDPAGSLAYAKSLRRLMTPPRAEASALLRHGTRHAWRFGTVECGLDELKAAGRAGGGTLNDAYISALLGGLRRYHDAVGVPLGDIPMTMPVSIRRPGDPEGGNRFAAAFFAAPSSVADPIERMAALRAAVGSVSQEPAIAFLDSALTVLNLAPTPIVAGALQAMQARSDIAATNVPGVPFETYVAGALVERMFCFGPLPGTSLCAALCSHAGVCCIGLNVDGSAFTDVALLWSCMNDAFEEVLALGKAAP